MFFFNARRTVSADTIARRARAAVESFRKMIDVLCIEEAEALLRSCHWNVTAALLEHFSGETARRPGARVWRKLEGRVCCATCFEAKDGNIEHVYSTDCSVALCGPCWGRYFSAMLSGGVRGPLRCPFPDCNSAVPMWLIEACFGTHDSEPDRDVIEAIMAVYRSELASDYVNASENLAYCPRPGCDRIIEVVNRIVEWRVACDCGYEFCFNCLREEHFPALCRTAREVNALISHDEVRRIAISLDNYRRCSGCGILIENVSVCPRLQRFAC